MKHIAWLLAVVALGLMVLCSLCSADIRSPGKYSGVVVFDRWDGCTLCNGLSIMYVSEKVKEQLRPYAGQDVIIDAKEVYQPINPGDGLIRKLEYLGRPDKAKSGDVDTRDLRFHASMKTGKDGKPAITITIENTGKKLIRVISEELALTLLANRDKPGGTWGPFDGPSFVVTSSQSLGYADGDHPEKTRWKGRGTFNSRNFAWSLGEENALPHVFKLEPGEKRKIVVQWDLPDGEYDFLCGYRGVGRAKITGHQCVVSNLTAFDVKDGKAMPVKVNRKGHAEVSAKMPSKEFRAAYHPPQVSEEFLARLFPIKGRMYSDRHARPTIDWSPGNSRPFEQFQDKEAVQQTCWSICSSFMVRSDEASRKGFRDLRNSGVAFVYLPPDDFDRQRWGGGGNNPDRLGRHILGFKRNDIYVTVVIQEDMIAFTFEYAVDPNKPEPSLAEIQKKAAAICPFLEDLVLEKIPPPPGGDNASWAKAGLGKARAKDPRRFNQDWVNSVRWWREPGRFGVSSTVVKPNIPTGRIYRAPYFGN